MQEVDFENECKVIVVGNGQVGKTSMITRFAKGVFTNSYKKTVGTDFMEREMFLRNSGESIKLLLWDTAGQEMFSQLTRQYYRGSGAVVFAFSTTDRDSFLAIESWKKKVHEECGEIPCVLVQNKIDLLNQAQVEPAEVEDLARRLGIKLYRTCVKDNLLVDDVFEYLAESFVNRGGNAGLGTLAVASVDQINRDAIMGGSAKPAPKPEAAAKENANVSDSDNSAGDTVKLGPSKRRTDGKKSSACAIL